MKKILLFISFIALTVSCSDDITGLNVDTKNPTTTKPEYLFTNAQHALVDQIVNASVNKNVFRLFTQYWAETTYPDESQYNLTTRPIPDFHFTTLYRDVLRDFKESKTALDGQIVAGAAETAVLNNKKAIVAIMSAYTYSVLVDTFGDVPYTEALDIEGHPLPKYDDAQTIYKDLISKLTTASAALDASAASFGSADLIYGGNAAKWKKFANSLRLRLAVNMYDVDAAYATAQINAAVSDGLITSNADNADLHYLGAEPNANQLYVDIVASNRKDFVIADTFVNKLNDLSDPRRAKYFTFAPETTNYIGGTYGASNSYTNYSHINETILEPTFPGTIFDYTETQFLLAEAAARGVAVGGTAITHYNTAITASMESWGVDAADTALYLAQPSVVFDAVNWKKSIGEQAWIALYNRGFEAWTSWRRLDFPVLVAPASTYNDITSVPTRYKYPAGEQTVNAKNVTAASALITGGDLLTTKVFWDKH
ncbi:SusD/RagB family nutrient-binding outer membrane lipoprotein [Flavobacterium sp. 83]|uniref:SusD/RagB family nutrient-binding outer membrane lipoprotein n=1 Tax=Flavobacterium sp. 83 TaxID=1131812 RepID=UPI0005501049|nr:SusD/RagB family nutrient-binding outer membrane lipoprotein [Flavobacterium sp. 83]